MNPDGAMMIMCGAILIGVGITGAWISSSRFSPDVSLLTTLGFVAVLALGFWLSAEGVLTITKGVTGCTQVRNSLQP